MIGAYIIYDINYDTNFLNTGGAAGDVIYWNGTKFTRLGIGTAGQVLQVNSGATAPEYATLSTGMPKLGSTELAASAESISLTGLTGKEVLSVDFFVRVQNTSGGNLTPTFSIRFNNDSGANYSFERARNGTRGTGTSATGIQPSGSSLRSDLQVVTWQGKIIIADNAAARKKACYLHASEIIEDQTAATAPATVECTGFWSNTTDQITRIDMLHDHIAASAEILAGSRILVYGEDTA